MSLNDIQKRIREAHFQGASADEMKQLYIERNSFNLAGNEDIYRIFEFTHLIDDLKNEVISMAEINKRSFDCDQENPLHGKQINVDGESALMAEIVEGYYGSSWSIERLSKYRTFVPFGTAIRIKSTPNMIMNSLVDLQDPFYGHKYFIGKVNYIPKVITQEWSNSLSINDMDDQGISLAQSFYRLDGKDYSDEEEVRLIVNRTKEEPYASRNCEFKLIANVNLCSFPFNWQKGVIEYETFSDSTAKEKAEVEKIMSSFGIPQFCSAY